MKRELDDVKEAAARPFSSTKKAICLSSVICCALQLTASSARSDVLPSDPSPSWYAGTFSGQFRSVYQYQSLGSEKDSDLYEYFYMSDRDLLKKHLDFYVSGKLHKDLDGTTASLADDFYVGLEDSGKTTDNYLYQLYFDAHDKDRQFALRAGRQYIDVADGLHIDGGLLSVFEKGRLGGRIFYGLPVSYYSSVSGDKAMGGSIICRPWTQNDSRITYVRYHDDDRAVDDERYSFTSWQKWNDEIRSFAQAAELNGDFESAGLDLSFAPTASDFDCSIGVRRWGGVAGNSVVYSPLSQVLGARAPYTYISARASKGILPWLYVSPGVSARLLADGDKDANNRDYMHYDLTIVVEPSRAWNASVAGEYWKVDQSDSFVGLSGEIMYRHQRVWELSIGAGYYHYDYEQFSDFSGTINAGDVRYSSDGVVIESSPDSFSYFAQGKYNISRSVSLKVRGEIEDNSELSERSFFCQMVLLIRI